MQLINLSKNELGNVSKNIVEQIIIDLANNPEHNQWKNNSCVIERFKNINERNKYAVIQLDSKEFYPSVTEEILQNAITFSKGFISIIDPDLRIIKHCSRSLLFSKEEVWNKNSTAIFFDVTMGSYDGAEICKLVGVYILPHRETIIKKKEMELYRDNGLLILRGANSQKTDKTRKKLKKFLKTLGLRLISWPI